MRAFPWHDLGGDACGRGEDESGRGVTIVISSLSAGLEGSVCTDRSIWCRESSFGVVSFGCVDDLVY